jgi:hypothetical protein
MARQAEGKEISNRSRSRKWKRPDQHHLIEP